MTFKVASEEEMMALGERLGRELPSRAVLLVVGNLGAGKTTLAKGIAVGLGAARAEEVSSPTFTLIHEYGDPVRMYHVDLYRLESERQVATLGLEEIFDREAVVFVEWADKFPRLFPREHVRIEIAMDGTGRRVTVT